MLPELKHIFSTQLTTIFLSTWDGQIAHMWICQACNSKNENDVKEFCSECMTPREISYPERKTMFSNHSNEETKNSKGHFFNKGLGLILVGLSLIIASLLAWNTFKPAPKYAYKVINVQAHFNKGATSDPDRGPTSVNLNDDELSLLGKDGWELVGTFLELETTHPNYGNAEYVTGLQPNVRPQRVVLLFKKQL